jgi:hypothetical protein
MNSGWSNWVLGATLLLLAWLTPVATIHAVGPTTNASETESPKRVSGAVSSPPARTNAAKLPRVTATPPQTKRSERTAQSSRRTAPLKLDVKEAARNAAIKEKPSLHVFPQAGLTDNLRQNIYGPASPPIVEMGDRPARSLGLCGDGKYRRFAELDTRTVTALLPEFNTVRPRSICARRGVVIADYSFK